MISQFSWMEASLMASRNLHEKLAARIMGTTLRFLDKTPVGRIIQRFTKDIGSVDSLLSLHIQNTIHLTLHVSQKLIVVALFAPAFIIPSMFLAIVGVIVGQLYIRAQLPVKR